MSVPKYTQNDQVAFGAEQDGSLVAQEATGINEVVVGLGNSLLFPREASGSVEVVDGLRTILLFARRQSEWAMSS